MFFLSVFGTPTGYHQRFPVSSLLHLHRKIRLHLHYSRRLSELSWSICDACFAFPWPESLPFFLLIFRDLNLFRPLKKDYSACIHFVSSLGSSLLFFALWHHPWIAAPQNHPLSLPRSSVLAGSSDGQLTAHRSTWNFWNYPLAMYSSWRLSQCYVTDQNSSQDGSRWRDFLIANGYFGISFVSSWCWRLRVVVFCTNTDSAMVYSNG